MCPPISYFPLSANPLEREILAYHLTCFFTLYCFLFYLLTTLLKLLWWCSAFTWTIQRTLFSLCYIIYCRLLAPFLKSPLAWFPCPWSCALTYSRSILAFFHRLFFRCSPMGCKKIGLWYSRNILKGRGCTHLHPFPLDEVQMKYLEIQQKMWYLEILAPEVGPRVENVGVTR